MTHLTLETLQQRIGVLPVLPEAVSHTLALLDDGAGYAEIEESISQDPGLAAHVLRLANSAFFGFAGRIGNLRDACLVLGHQTLRQVVTAIGAMQALPENPGSPLDHEALWRHALGTASAARLLAEQLPLDPGTAATAGLLHDLGRLTFNIFLPEEYAEVQRYQIQHDADLAEAELAVIGLDHTETGTWLARRWRLPEALVSAIANHHTPDAGEPRLLVDVVHLADIVARRYEIGTEGYDLVPAPAPGAWRRIGLDWKTIEATVTEAQLVHDSELFAAA